MMILEIIVLLLIAGICGSIAQALVGYTHGGCLVSIVLGFIGALFGVWLSQLMGLPELLPIPVGDREFPILWSIIGASLFVAILGLLAGGYRRRTY
jgi:uncharacterized membrane protein YeaQ/YmgE (transglycosylase-associated protein family)